MKHDMKKYLNQWEQQRSPVEGRRTRPFASGDGLATSRLFPQPGGQGGNDGAPLGGPSFFGAFRFSKVLCMYIILLIGCLYVYTYKVQPKIGCLLWKMSLFLIAQLKQRSFCLFLLLIQKEPLAGDS